MNPLLYCLIGVAGGALLAAFVFFLTRRDSKIGPLILGKIELLERAQEREEKVFRDELARNREENANAAKSQREELTASLESVRGIVDLRLQELQKDNAQQIERMRATVDEKLQGTLEKRLGESFKLVSERLEKVHQGLGAMQQLASDVGGLQRVLTNVKDTRRLGRSATGRRCSNNCSLRNNSIATSKREMKAANEWIMRSNCRAKEMAQQCGCRSTPNFRWKIISD
jgi:DNA recombination protein RmuC